LFYETLCYFNLYIPVFFDISVKYMELVRKKYLTYFFALNSGQDKGVLMNMQNAFWQDNEEDNV